MARRRNQPEETKPAEARPALPETPVIIHAVDSGQDEAPPPANSTAGNESGQASAPTPPPGGSEKAGVMTIPLTADGAPAWDSMRESTKQKFMKVVAAAGVSLDSHRTSEDFKQLVPFLWGTVSTLTTWAAMRRLTNGESDPLAHRIAQVCAYTPAELEVLEGPTAAMLAKYAPTGGKWAVEISFATCVLTVHMQKMMILQTELARSKANEAARAPANNLARPAASEQ